MDVALALRAALAETWAFYFQSHSYHWNIVGSDFVSLHKFFGDLYEDAQDAVDGLAEQLRALHVYAPTSLNEIDALSKITFSSEIPDADGMVAKLSADNDLVLMALDEAQKAAVEADEQGLANYLQDRLDTHKKFGWMLKALNSPAPAWRQVMYDAKRRV